MKNTYDVDHIKNIGQFFVCPLLGIFLAILAIRGGGITGYWAIMFGVIIFIGLTLMLLVVFDKLIIQRIIENNERIEKERKAHIRKLMEEENDPNEYTEYDD